MAISDLWLDASKMQVKVAGQVMFTQEGSLRVGKALNNRSTASFNVLDPTGVLNFSQGMPVEVWSSTDPTVAKKWFGGVVMTAKRRNTGWNAGMLHEVRCVDWHYCADKRVAATTYANQTAGFIFNDLLKNYLAAEGVLGLNQAPILTRASVAYYINGSTDPFASSVTSGTARYEAGAIASSKAIRIEEGTTNLFTANQSDVETNTTGFSVAASTIINAGATITRDTTHKWANTAALKIVTTNAVSSEGAEAQITSLSANTTYAVTVWLDGTGGQQWQLVARDFTNSVQVVQNVTLGADWTKVTLVITTGASAVTDFRVAIKTTSAVAQTVWADGWQVEAKKHTTTWTPGGTPRNTETLKLPIIGALNPQQGTVQFRALIGPDNRRQEAGSSPHLFGANKTDGGGGLFLFHSDNTSNWVLGVSGVNFASFADSSTPDGWHKFAVCWDVVSALVYVDGALQATINNPTLPSGWQDFFWLGSDGVGSSQQNTDYQDVRFSSRKRTAAEIAADAALTTFLPGDSDTSYIAQLNNSLASSAPTIDAGPTITSFLVNYVPASKAFEDLCALTGYVYQIDVNKLAQFKPATAYPAPWTFDGTMALDVDHDVSTEDANPLYRNGQWILGIPDVTTTQTESRKGDGANRVFVMSYPLHSTPTITVNGVGKTVGIGQVDTGKDWYWNKSKNEIFQDPGGTLLISTDTFQAVYIGEWVSNVYAQDGGAITTQQMIEGAGTGIVEEAHNEPAITTVAQGFALAGQLLARYAQDGTTLEFTTRQAGLDIQQALSVGLPANWSLTGVTALIESIDITEDGFWWIFTVKAIIGPVNNDWVQYIQRSYNPLGLDVGSAGSGSTVAILQPETAAWNWTASYTATVTSCPVPSTTLFPNTTLFPC